MALGLLAAAALGTAYIDAKTLISEDSKTIAHAISNALAFVYSGWKGEIQWWYAFEKTAKKYPKNIALLFPKLIPNAQPAKYGSLDNLFEIQTYTYQHLYNEVLKMSHFLHHKYGVTNNDIVSINSMNSPLFIIIWFAIWNLGATPAFINYNISDESLIHCIKVGNSSIMFVDMDVANNVLPIVNEIKNEAKCETVFMDDSFLAAHATSPAYRAPNSDRHPENKSYDTAILIYTSGTTGFPKPAIMPWRRAKLASSLYGDCICLNDKSIVYSSMPLYHSTAAVLGVLPTLSRGAAYAIGAKFSTTTFWTQVKLVRASHIQYVGETCRYLLNSAPSPDEKKHNVKIAFGNGMRRDIWIPFKKRFNIPCIGEFYASSESPFGTTNFQQGEFGVGSMGRYGSLLSFIFKMNQVIVPLNPEDDSELWRDPSTGFCRVAAYDEPGELLQRILNPGAIHETFQGYYGNNKANESKIARNVFKKGDAYYRSGDLVRLSADNCYYFVDRLGDTFRWKSENVSTSEVEEHVCASDPNIEQVICIGIRIPNHEGRAGFAVIKLRDPTITPDFQGIAKYLSKKLPNYAVPLFIKFVNEIEQTGNNKVQKNKYKNQNISHFEEGSPIYWFKNNNYVEFKMEDFTYLESGKVRL